MMNTLDVKQIVDHLKIEFGFHNLQIVFQTGKKDDALFGKVNSKKVSIPIHIRVEKNGRFAILVGTKGAVKRYQEKYGMEFNYSRIARDTKNKILQLEKINKTEKSVARILARTHRVAATLASTYGVTTNPGREISVRGTKSGKLKFCLEVDVPTDIGVSVVQIFKKAVSEINHLRKT